MTESPSLKSERALSESLLSCLQQVANVPVRLDFMCNVEKVPLATKGDVTGLTIRSPRRHKVGQPGEADVIQHHALKPA